MKAIQLAAIEARLAAITPTEWLGASVPSNRKYGVIGTTDKKGRSYAIAVLSAVPATHRHADTQFIAHAPEDVRALLEEVKRLRSGLKTIGTHCTSFTGKTTCITAGRTRGARYSAEAWCEGCIARDALDPQN